MATLHGTQMGKLRVAPQAVPDPGFVDGTLRVFCEEIALSGQPTADTVAVARLPKGAVPLFGVLLTDTPLGTATIALGVAGDGGRYRAAAPLTVTDTPELFGTVAATGAALGAEETVLLSIGTAALPRSGTLRVMFVYSFD
ncbi:MAG: hypothetical protein JSU82_04885 [Rhodospirillales bacterium]|nr:MAG: hypothetical protein JSU82_04885 [Rhodospirillales bacterium]